MPRANRFVHVKGTYLRMIRFRLGLTQDHLAGYLGVLTLRVADAENGRRFFTDAVLQRSEYLRHLIPPTWFTTPPPPPPDLPPPPAALPVPLPPLTPQLLKELKIQLDRCSMAAYRLRYRLKREVEQAHTWQLVLDEQRALLAAFATPPAAALAFRAQYPDNSPGHTELFVNLLTGLVRINEQYGNPLSPAYLARETLRLHLLEAEAATLTAWLAAPPPNEPGDPA